MENTQGCEGLAFLPYSMLLFVFSMLGGWEQSSPPPQVILISL